MTQKYPKHIYEPIRYEVASSIISHELKKIFPDFSAEEYAKLEKQVCGWASDPKKYSLSQEPRDFWNGVEGIMTGFRLKGVVRLITSENVTWSREEVAPEKFIFTTDHFSLEDVKIPTLNKPATEVLAWLKNNNYLEAAIKKVEDAYSKGLPRVTDPIYGKKDKEGKYYAHDGNGRVLFALLKNIPTLTAYIGEAHEEHPRNYWVYTMFLINLSSMHKKEILTDEEYKKILNKIFNETECALIEYKDRVPDTDEIVAFVLGA